MSAPGPALQDAVGAALANREHLERELERMRLLVHRRVLWLRHRWRNAPPAEAEAIVIAEAVADRLLEGDDLVAEAAFYRKDEQAAGLGRRAAELDRRLAAESEALAEAGRPPRIATLARLLGLTRFERDVVVMCLAPELDPTFERLLAYVQDDVTRPFVTPHLASALLAGPGEPALRAWDSLLPEAPLRRYRLIAADDSAPGPAASRPLRLEERVADYLLGADRLDGRIGHLLRPVPPAPLTAEHDALVDGLARTLEAAGRRGPWPSVNLVGPPRSGRRAVARALSERLGLRLLRLDAGRLPPPGRDRTAALHLLERDAVLLQLAYFVEADGGEDEARATREALERMQGLLFVASAERWQGDRELLPASVPKPDVRGRRLLWERALGDGRAALDGRLDELVHQFEFGPAGVARAAAAARAKALMREAGEQAAPTVDEVWEASREQTAWQLDHLALRIEPSYGWDDIVLPPDEARQLTEIADQVANRAKVYENWGFGARLSRGRGISALFSGPSGTGKTMAAEILANHVELDLYRIDLAGVISKWVGETERNLRRVFDAAEQSGAILFFDEADALFGKRSEVKDSHDRYANIEINYLLQRMEDYRGLAILATNRKSLLDEAFLRRLRFLVDFPFPDADARERIWRRVFPEETEVGLLDWEFLAGLEIAGGNIRNIALNAAFLAAAAGRPVAMADLVHAARREYAKIDKLLLEAEFGAYFEEARA